MEVWKDIGGYEGHYQVSNKGNVMRLNYRSTGNARRLKPAIRNGYYGVILSKNGIHSSQNIHRLVALAFVPNPKGLDCVNHKDETRTNNSPDNLEWCTYRYNNCYGTRVQRVVEKHNKAVIQRKTDYLSNDGRVLRKWNRKVIVKIP